MGMVVHERWTCRICTSADLDAGAHQCCPNCGHARDVDASRLPTWEELLAQPEDRFAGTQTTCCKARFCGRCGSDLALAERLEHPVVPMGVLVGLGALSADVQAD